jgi:Ankyrin repeats (3 copies)
LRFDGFIFIFQFMQPRGDDDRAMVEVWQTMAQAARGGDMHAMQAALFRGHGRRVLNTIVAGRNSILGTACARPNEDMIAMLVLAGADVNVVDGAGETPLLAACRGTALRNVLALVEHHHAAVNVCDRNGNTPLMLAVSAGRTAMAGILLRNGADVAVLDRVGSSALHWARVSEIASQLCEAGAVVDQRDVHGVTPFRLSCMRGWDDIAVMLLRCGADPAQDIGPDVLPPFSWVVGESRTTFTIRDAAINRLGCGGAERAHREWLEALDDTSVAKQRWLAALLQQPGRHTKACR